MASTARERTFKDSCQARRKETKTTIETFVDRKHKNQTNIKSFNLYDLPHASESAKVLCLSKASKMMNIATMDKK